MKKWFLKICVFMFLCRQPAKMAHFVYPTGQPQPTAAYPTVQTAYVAAAPQAAYAAAAAPRAAGGYEGYQTTPAAPQYAYTRTQVAVTVSITT